MDFVFIHTSVCLQGRLVRQPLPLVEETELYDDYDDDDDETKKKKN